MGTSRWVVRGRAVRLSLAGAGVAGLLLVPAVLANPVQAPERDEKDRAAAERSERRAMEQAGRAGHRREMERLGDRLRGHQDEMERLGEELGRAAAELAEAVTYAHLRDAEDGHRRDVERARRHVRELARQMREVARVARPSAGEMRRMRQEARAWARSAQPTLQEREELRREIHEAMREARKELERAREEIRRAIRDAYREGVI